MRGATPALSSRVRDVSRPGGDLKGLTACQRLLLFRMVALLGGRVVAVLDGRTLPEPGVAAHFYLGTLLQASGPRKWCSGLLILIRC